MDIAPLCTGDLETTERAAGGTRVRELSENAVGAFLSRARSVQSSLSSIPVSERLAVFDEVTNIWVGKVSSGRLSALRQNLSASTGYSERMIDLEFSLVPEMLNSANLQKNLDASFIGGARSLEAPARIAEGEHIRQLPAGPVFIISSGNSLIPPLIPTTLSLVTGNLTLLRPSLANYAGVSEVYSALSKVPSKTARLFEEALALSYFSHDSPVLKHLLTKAGLGVINFWGGEPARTSVGMQIAENRSHPRLIVNGPMTGHAIIDAPSADAAAALGLAKNIVLYDQQLCSSPTQAAFIGDYAQAEAFALAVGEALGQLSLDYPLRLGEGATFALQGARRFLLFKGSNVLASKGQDSPWTVVVSRSSSTLDELVSSSPEFGLMNRRRFIEIIAVGTPEAAVRLVRDVPSRRAFMGVDRVQSIGLAVSEHARQTLLESLSKEGVYRIVPLGDMFMRSAVEPYDGVSLAGSFTYSLYVRDDRPGTRVGS
jgi:hypothetical protein